MGQGLVFRSRHTNRIRKRGGICTGMSQNLVDALSNRATKTIVSNSEFMMILDQGVMDRDILSELFTVSNEQINCVNGAEPGTGLIRFSEKIVPFSNKVESENGLYKLFNAISMGWWGVPGGFRLRRQKKIKKKYQKNL